MKNIILFDGVCNFCNHSVQFIIKRDPFAYFCFASLQSEAGVQLMEKHRIPENIDSLILIQNDKWHSKSSAVFRICKHLSGPWKLLFPLLIIPKPIRDIIYHIIAKNRYLISRKQSKCIIPTSDSKHRFL